ncbi:hypothetical protein TNCV_249191 [Trichonephila clavipes]|nr:hypothetical protein TNCV_249191 [Trichonephila clavipes]
MGELENTLLFTPKVPSRKRSQENLAVHVRSERQESVEQHSEQNTQEDQSLSKQDLGGRTSSSRPRRRIPLGNVEGIEKEEVPSLRP